MSNEQKMTLEEKLVQTVKNDTLMKLVGDEDAITELVTRAMREALFQPRQGQDSPLVAATRKIAEDYAKQMASVIFEGLMADPANKQKVVNAIVAALPQAIMGTLQSYVQTNHQASMWQRMEELKSMGVVFKNP